MTIQTIENAIFQRDFAQARQEIKKYRKACKFSPESALWAAVYYRWMGYFSDAIRLLSDYAEVKGLEKAPQTTLYLQMELARVMTCVGGEDIALKIGQRIHAVQPGKTPQQLAYLQLWFGHYRDALPYFEKYSELTDDEIQGKDFNDTIGKLIFSATCLSHLGQFDRALKVFKRILSFTKEPYLLLKIQTELSELYFLRQDYSQALLESSKAIELLENLPDSDLQYATSYLVHAGNLIFADRADEANKILQRFKKTALHPGKSPNLWLHTLYWIGLIKVRAGVVGFPEEWQNLLVYPNQDNSFFRNRIEQFAHIPKTVFIERHKTRSELPSVHFDMTCDTVFFRHANGIEFRQLGMNLVDRAVCFLICAGENGVSQYRFYDLLWPGDMAINQLRRRISQVVQRLRKSGYVISWDEFQIKLTDYRQMSCLWSEDQAVLGESFLSKHPRFVRSDLERFYSLSRSGAVGLCTDWLRKNKIKKVSRGRITSYEVVLDQIVNQKV